MNPRSLRVAPRVALGVAVLLAALVAMVSLSVPYWENRQFEDELTAVVARNASSGWTAERWEQAAREAAARRGVPAAASAVRVELRPTGPRLEVRYQKNVDLFVYSVRLHLRAKSGS